MATPDNVIPVTNNNNMEPNIFTQLATTLGLLSSPDETEFTTSRKAFAGMAYQTLIIITGFRLWLKMVRKVARAALLPSSIIGINLPQLQQMRDVAGGDVKQVKLYGGLDGIITGNSKGKKWLVFLNANGVCYEHVLNDLHKLGLLLNRRVLAFNWRGVGLSQGEVMNANDLVDDVTKAVEYLITEQGVDRKNILLWGHSIGGAAAVLASHRLGGDIAVFADRTFARLDDVVRDKIKDGPIAALVSGLIATSFVAFLTVAGYLGWGTSPWPMVRDGDSQTNMARCALAGVSVAVVAMKMGSAKNFLRPFLAGGATQYLFAEAFESLGWRAGASAPAIGVAAFAVCFVLGSMGLCDTPLLWLVKRLGWELNPGKVWKELKGKKAMTFHKLDEMISVPWSLSTIREKEDLVIELLGGANKQTLHPNAPVCHMYSLSSELPLPDKVIEFCQ